MLKKKNDILQFNWLDDPMFDTWMVDIASDEKFEEVEIDEDEVQDDEVHIIDTSAPVLREKEDESLQLVPFVEIEAQDVDMIEEQ